MSIEWEEVDVPRGAYIGWGNQPGQCVVGKVVNYDPTGGTDYNDDECPSLELELTQAADSFNKEGQRTTYEAGETLQLNCGQVSLKRAVRRAALKSGLKSGDLVRITLVNLAKSGRGKSPVKEFAIAVGHAAPQEPPLSTGSIEGDGDDDSPLY
jgi:hypothetical protein